MKAQQIELSEVRQELMPSYYCQDPAEIAGYNDKIRVTTIALAELPARHERIMRLYQGINVHAMFIKSIANENEVSGTRINQLLCISMRKMREKDMKRLFMSIKDYIEK